MDEELLIRASEGDVSILSDDRVDKVKDFVGWTPLHWLAEKGLVKQEYIRQRYPWYKRTREGKVTRDEITEIINTPLSMKFILEN